MVKDYLTISTARDFLDKRREYWIYRALEILPGFLAWLTLAAVVFFSWTAPVWTAFFIIAFDTYWLLKVIFLSFHQRAAFNQMRAYMKIDWLAKLVDEKPLWEEVYHLVLLPAYKEDVMIIDQTLQAIIKSNYPNEKIIVVLALEQRAGEFAQNIASQMKRRYAASFNDFITTVHPTGIPGELAGKGSNIAYAAREAKRIIDEKNIDYSKIIVSAFDIDTRVYGEYFGCLTWHFLSCDSPTRTGFQPVPIYNNNIWQAPFFSRVVATSATFWHMMQQERPERLATFSSHAHSFQALVDMDFWPVGNVSEDSRVFWKALLAFDGNYRIVPLYYPVSMDANLARTFWQTALNVYKQQRRWGWGVENVPYFLYGGIKNKKMDRRIFWRFAFVQLEGFWSWATNALLIFILGFLPLYLGGPEFNTTVLAINLPILTRTIMSVAMIGLVVSAIYSLKLLPSRPPGYRWYHKLAVLLQWIILPISIIIFGALPGLEAQTRLMIGKYMGFWVTDKHR